MLIFNTCRLGPLVFHWVLVAEQVDALREALAAFLAAAPETEYVGETRDGAELLHLARHWPDWDVFLIDRGLIWSHGPELLQRLGETCPGVPVLLLISQGGDTAVQMYLRTGAAGVLDPAVAFDELWPAIEQVRQGNCYVSPSLGASNVTGPAEAVTVRAA